MLGFVIGDSQMTMGFRLVGVEGQEVNSTQEAGQALRKALTRKDLALILISQEYSSQLRDEVSKAREESVVPIVLEVPGFRGTASEIKISDYIAKSLGIRV